MTPAPHPGAQDRARRGWLVAGWMILATALQLVRGVGVPAWDTVWAEDGAFFLSDAMEEPWGSVLLPLSGYLQVPSRLFGALAAAFPLGWASEILAVGPAIVVSLLSVYVFVASRSLLPSAIPRAMVAGLIPLLPAATIESVANAANLQYFLLFACFWALIHQPRSRWQAFAGCSVALGTALNTLFAWLYLPLAARQWGTATRRGRLVLLFFAGGVMAQAVAVFASVILAADPTYGSIMYSPSDPLDLPGLYGLRVVGGLLLGIDPLASAWWALGWPLVAALSVGLVALLAHGLLRNCSARAWVAVALAYSVAMFSVPVLLRGTEHLALEMSEKLSGARYTLTPMWFLLVAVALALWGRTGSDATRSTRLLRVAFPLLLAFTVVSSFGVATYRSEGPRWSAGLEAARAGCAATDASAVSVPIAPGGSWAVAVPCERITGPDPG